MRGRYVWGKTPDAILKIAFAPVSARATDSGSAPSLDLEIYSFQIDDATFWTWMSSMTWSRDVANDVNSVETATCNGNVDFEWWRGHASCQSSAPGQWRGAAVETSVSVAWLYKRWSETRMLAQIEIVASSPPRHAALWDVYTRHCCSHFHCHLVDIYHPSSPPARAWGHADWCLTVYQDQSRGRGHSRGHQWTVLDTLSFYLTPE